MIWSKFYDTGAEPRKNIKKLVADDDSNDFINLGDPPLTEKWAGSVCSACNKYYAMKYHAI